MRAVTAWLRSAVMTTTRLANYDFCPWANRYVYWLRKPIGWFVVGAAAAASVAVFLAPQAWIIFSSLVVVILMGVVWPWVAIRGAIPSLEFDRRRCSEKVSTQVTLSIENRWPWPLWGLTLEGLDDSSRPVASLARVPGWSRSEFHCAFRPGRRGIYPATAPRLATGFPFGIFCSHRPVTVDRPLVVWPHAARLKSIPVLSGTIPHVLGMRLDRPGDEGDTLGVRPYRHGDRLRSIHWAHTARRDLFIVRERQASALPIAIVNVDLEALLARSEEDLENAIRVSASVARALHSHHTRVRFVLGDIDMMLDPGIAGLHRLLDRLAYFSAADPPVMSPSLDSVDAAKFVVTAAGSVNSYLKRDKGQTRLIFIGDEQREGGGSDAWISVRGTVALSSELSRQWERACHGTVIG